MRAPDLTVSEKACARCQGPRHWTGSRWRCTTCYNAWQKQRRQSLPDEQRAAELARSNELRQQARDNWTAQKRAEVNAQVAEWRENNRQQHRDGTRDWYHRNADRARANKLAEYYADKSKFFARNFLRKARRLAAICEHGDSCVSSEFLAVLYSQPCFYCGAETTDADHFQPLARGGLHCQSNLVPACGPCNGSKHARNPVEFLVGVRGDQ